MDFSPVINAPTLVQIHIASALLALGLGLVIFLGPKGTRLHKGLGKLWAVAMAIVIISSGFIFELRLFGPFSPIHVLSLLAAWWLFQAINHARHGRIAAHRSAMAGLAFWALGIAGVFTFWPGRIFSRMFFANSPMFGFYIVMALFLAISSAYWLGTSRRKATHEARP